MQYRSYSYVRICVLKVSKDILTFELKKFSSVSLVYSVTDSPVPSSVSVTVALRLFSKLSSNSEFMKVDTFRIREAQPI